MDEEQLEELPQQSLTKEQKIGVSLLLVFAVIAVSLGLLQIRNTLYGPFALNNQVPVTIKDEVNSVDSLKYRDTDHDGLNDFDELYIYHTSPYLYDTFGYGMSDKDVVAKGLPLCPGAGKNCGDQLGGVAPSSTMVAEQLTGLSATEVSANNAPPDLATVLQNPTQLRQMLLATGMDASVLSKVNDSDLLTLARQLVNSSSTLASQLTASTTVSSSTR